jgi:mono/diheme cytochrome c family protein
LPKETRAEMRRHLRTILAVSAILAGALGGLWIGVSMTPAASTKPPEAAGGFKPDKVALATGKQVYDQYCATCHGAEGKGDGIAGAGLPIKPQDLTAGLILNPLPDHMLYRAIAEGPQSIGLSDLMPPFSPQLNERQINNVIVYIRTLAVPAFDPAQVLPVARERRGPVQPIFFSHVIHAGSFRIDCQYCHANARRSSSAGVPSVERCMGCHKIVAAEGNPHVAKLKGYWDRQEPIPWVRVFKIPEHAQFPHKNHVQAGVPCQTCHGQIEAMEQVYAETGQGIVNDLMNLVGIPAEPRKLTMGWCVECHRAANSNDLASLSWVQPVPKLTREHPAAPLDCVTCHH